MKELSYMIELSEQTDDVVLAIFIGGVESGGWAARSSGTTTKAFIHETVQTTIILPKKVRLLAPQHNK